MSEETPGTFDRELLQKARQPCPKCGRKGVGYAMHPHATGWKDYDRAKCRYCHARFRLKHPNSQLP